MFKEVGIGRNELQIRGGYDVAIAGRGVAVLAVDTNVPRGHVRSAIRAAIGSSDIILVPVLPKANVRAGLGIVAVAGR